MAKELKKNKAQMVMPESKEDKKKALESAIAHIPEMAVQLYS